MGWGGECPSGKWAEPGLPLPTPGGSSSRREPPHPGILGFQGQEGKGRVPPKPRLPGSIALGC